MDLIKELLLIAVLLLYPIGIGGLCDLVMKKGEKERTLCGAYVSGCLVYGVVFGVLVLLGQNRGWQFGRIEKTLLSVSIILPIGCGLVMVLLKRFRFAMKQMLSSVWKLRTKDNALWVVSYASVALVYLFYPFYISDTFSMPEQVFSLVKTGELHTAKENLALFYACLCEWFALPAKSVLFDVIPYITLALSFCVIAELGDAFFGTDRRAKSIFSVCYTLLILFGNEAHMNPPYGLLHFPYEGMTLISNVLIPYMFVLLLKKRNILYAAMLIFLAVVLEPLQKGSVVLTASVCVFGIASAAFFLWERRKRK